MGSSEQSKRGFMVRYEAALAPWTKGRGIDWEVQITEDDASKIVLPPQ